MAKRDHEPYFVDPIRGLYLEGSAISPPRGYLSRAQNVVYSVPALPDDEEEVVNTAKVRVREQFGFTFNLPSIPVKFYFYTKSSGNRIIMLDADGKFWDALAGTNILTIPDAIDFHGITMNDRFLFTPHDRETGLPGQFVFIYDPDLSNVARKICGAPLTGTFTGATSAVAGKIEPGLHVVAISYQTDTGFISKPSLHASFTAPNPRKKFSLTAIPLGPSFTVKRIIWMSQVVKGQNVDLLNVPLFRAYTIDNNTSTTLVDTIDVYDTELIDPADPYTQALAEVPAGTFLTDLDGRLAVCGDAVTPHVLRVSNSNEPENFDSVDGIKEVVKATGGGIKTTRAQLGNLLWWKRNMTGILRANSGTPAEWDVEVIDWSLGSEVYGVSESLNLPNTFYGTYLVANQLGLNVFNGANYTEVIHPLSEVIVSLWARAFNYTHFNTVKVLVDPINFRVYVLIKDMTETVRWFMGDFRDGLTAEAIKWATWDFVYSAEESKNFIDAHVVVEPDINNNDTTILAIVDDDNGLRQLITNTFSSGSDFDGDISAVVGVKVSDPELWDLHLQSIRMMCSASEVNSVGKYEVQIGGDSATFVPQITDSMIEVPANVNDRIIEVFISALSADLNISALILYISKVAAERAI